MQRIFIAGCGYIGERIARSYQKSGADVACLVRSAEHGARLDACGFTTVISALDDQGTLPDLDVSARVLFYLVPPPGGGIADSRARNLIAHLSETGQPSKIVYMSATSVYGVTDSRVA